MGLRYDVKVKALNLDHNQGRGEAVGRPLQGPVLHAAGRGDSGAGMNIVVIVTIARCLRKSRPMFFYSQNIFDTKGLTNYPN